MRPAAVSIDDRPALVDCLQKGERVIALRSRQGCDVYLPFELVTKPKPEAQTVERLFAVEFDE
jgi:hypothetical protein